MTLLAQPFKPNKFLRGKTALAVNGGQQTGSGGVGVTRSGREPAGSMRNCGHACEPFTLASGICRMPLDLATLGLEPDATPDANAFGSQENCPRV